MLRLFVQHSLDLGGGQRGGLRDHRQFGLDVFFLLYQHIEILPAGMGVGHDLQVNDADPGIGRRGGRILGASSTPAGNNRRQPDEAETDEKRGPHVSTDRGHSSRGMARKPA